MAAFGNILIVEDDDKLRGSHQRIIGPEGYQVFEAGDSHADDQVRIDGTGDHTTHGQRKYSVCGEGDAARGNRVLD